MSENKKRNNLPSLKRLNGNIPKESCPNNDKNKSEEIEARRDVRNRFVIVIALALVALTFFIFASPHNEKVDYVEFLQQIENEEIEEITINSQKGDIFYKIDKKSYYTNYPYTDTFIESILLKGINVKYTGDKSLLSYLPYVTSILMVFVLLSFLKNTSKQFGDDDSFYKNVKKENRSKTNSFEDIAGMDEIKEDMRSLAELIKNKKYKEKGVEIPKGVLLDGPPGNGKTLLARVFASECGLNFIALNASDFGSPFVGVSTQKINKAFKDAKNIAPCVIFIDEIDAIGSKRTSAGSGAEKEFNSSLTALLNNMDGFAPTDDVIVMAATNRAEDLDAALVRPGRFDRKFTIGLPDKKTRLELFKLYTKNIKLSEDVNLDSLVSQTYGCSSATIKSIVNEALINSIKSERETVNGEDFSSAIVRMMLKGVEKKTERWEGKTKDTVAYHEAGHAVVGHLLGRNVSTISIIPTTASAGGYTLLDEEDEGIKSLSDYRNTIMVLYGGKAAEAVLANDEQNVSIGASQDIKQATRIASSFVNFSDGIDYSAFGDHGIEIVAEKAKRELDKRWGECYNLVKDNWEMVERVAEALKAKEKITAEEFLEIVGKDGEN